MNMRAKECACRRRQFTCLPCVHSMAMILRSNIDTFQFIDAFYKRENYLKAYSPVVYALNGYTLWPKSNKRPIQCLEFKK